MTITNPDAFAMAGDAGDEPVTAEQHAAYGFEPFSTQDVETMFRDFSMPKFAEEFGDHGVALRFASAILRLTKTEMVDAVEGVERDFSGEGPGPTYEVIDCLQRSRKRLRELSNLLMAAELRQLSAASVVELKLTEGGAA
jgi:hypothetical protein